MGGAGGVGSGAGGAGGSMPAGDPIIAPNQIWTWVDFPDAACANGIATGIGVNLSDASDKALIYLQGGGACWDEATCHTMPISANIQSGVTESDFTAVQGNLVNGVFDRNDGANPFRDWSFIFVPYCTGDLHAGSNIADYGGIPTHHVGYENMGAYLQRLVATFPGASQIVLTGSSAGGYGAGFNYFRASQAFGAVRVDLVNDGGPFISEPVSNAALEATWRASWDLDAIMPSDCATCLTKFYGLELHGIENNPNSRAALLSHTQDGVIGAYFGLTPGEMAFGHLQLGSEVWGLHAHANFFVIDGTAHTMLGNPGAFSTGGIGLMPWLTLMVTDDPTWMSVGP
jgi:hypothetical protein